MRQYNILVVDDESFVVDWLSELLGVQTQYDFNIYPAYNAHKAKEIIERTRIDLLMTDIRMPSITGLELVEHAHSLWPFCKSILLSAHADFEYAQQAIAKGVVSYILKTEDDVHILNEIKKAIEILDDQLKQQELISDTQKNLDNSLSQLKHQVFFHWLRGDYLDNLELEQYIEILGFSKDVSYYCLLIGSVDSEKSNHKKTVQLNDTLKVLQAKTVVEHFISPYINFCTAELHGDKILWIIDPKESTNIQFTTSMTGALEIAQQSCLETSKMSISFVFNVPDQNAQNIPNAYIIGKDLITNHNGDGGFILSYSLEQKNSKHAAIFPSMDQRLFNMPSKGLLKSAELSSLKKHIENGNRNEFLTILEVQCKQISLNVNWHSTFILESYYSIVLVLIAYINQNNLATKLAFKTSLGILFRPWLASNWNEIQEQLFLISNLLFDNQEEKKRRTILDSIDVIKNHVLEHITEDISLIDLSDITGYSTSYLSKFFSENVGITISEYIANCKIEKIKEFMLDPSLNIGDIAKEVGFNSRTYFNNYMKRHTGMAPQQYRDYILQLK